MTAVGLHGVSGRGLGLGLRCMTSVSPSEGTNPEAEQHQGKDQALTEQSQLGLPPDLPKQLRMERVPWNFTTVCWDKAQYHQGRSHVAGQPCPPGGASSG